MPENFTDLLHFQACRTLEGRLRTVTIGRRNGARAAVFAPSWTDGDPGERPSADWADKPKYYVNLNLVERQTWHKILMGQPISSIAREEGISRQAIYARIQGNRYGQGGMIGKNFWVLLWWRLRNRNLKHDQLD